MRKYTIIYTEGARTPLAVFSYGENEEQAVDYANQIAVEVIGEWDSAYAEEVAWESDEEEESVEGAIALYNASASDFDDPNTLEEVHKTFPKILDYVHFILA